MKYIKGDKVIFIKKSNKVDGWGLNDFEEYEITNVAFANSMATNYIDIPCDDVHAFYYGVTNKRGVETTWYEEEDFITVQEYRKLKLNKLNEIYKHY